MPLHLIKVAARIESLDHLILHQQSLAIYDPTYHIRIGRHWTRHRPKRADEIVSGGSVYWIIRGVIRARQRVIALEAHEKTSDDAKPMKYCAIVYDVDNMVLTSPRPRRGHQGWRYFNDEDRPPDLPASKDGVDPDMPADMRAELAALGLI